MGHPCRVFVRRTERENDDATTPEEDTMANPVPAGSDVSAGTYQCTNCGNQIDVGSTQHLPPCPSCGNGQWETMSGGDSVNDPYPDN